MPKSKSASIAPQKPLILGCDVSKAEIVCFNSQTRQIHKIPNQPPALRQFLKATAAVAAPDLLVCEATGGYEKSLLQTSIELAIDVHRADPYTSHNYIRSLHRHCKTDITDAECLARYGVERFDVLNRYQAPTKIMAELQDCAVAMRQLIADQTAVKNRAKSPLVGGFRAQRCQEHLAFLAEQIAACETEIKRIIASDAELTAKFAAITSIKGAGDKTAYVLLAFLPEIGAARRGQIAALAGMAPQPFESGNFKGKARIKGGRQLVKTALFMCALSAIRFNPKINAFYHRLIAAGKSKMTAIFAAARKLLIFINATLKNISPPHKQLA